jgi:hypothetical protein
MPSQTEEFQKQELSNHGNNFNWRLPILGALGFGFAFALLSAITGTNYEILSNKIAYIFEDTSPVSLTTGMFRGIITGAIGGGVMGFAYKEKKRVVQFAIRGALGFGFAFAGSVFYSFDLSGNQDFLVAGAIIGLIAGIGLGIGLKTDEVVLSFLLGLVGAIWFAIAFLIGYVLPLGSCAFWNAWAGFAGCSSWNGWAGAIGGTLFGTILAMYDKWKGSQNKGISSTRKQPI